MSSIFANLKSLLSFDKSPAPSRSGSPIFKKSKSQTLPTESDQASNVQPVNKQTKNPRAPSIAQRELPLRQRKPISYQHTRQYTRNPPVEQQLTSDDRNSSIDTPVDGFNGFQSPTTTPVQNSPTHENAQQVSVDIQVHPDVSNPLYPTQREKERQQERHRQFESEETSILNDPEYSKYIGEGFLEHYANTKIQNIPAQSLIDEIQNLRILNDRDPISDEEIAR